ncbi:LysE family translocator [uncultured Roseibium sp.]|uniref:LysE family translocator n=1 Tax=uncultured Roseibium sp. TaxID=1936171 RepID=UPI00321637E7
MSLENWFAFTIACIVLTLIPGPSVLLVIGQALTRGKRAAMMCIAGDLIGSIVLMGLSFLGVGAILAASAVLFQAVKWAGVLYLAYLGYRQIADSRKDRFELSGQENVSTGWGSLWAGAVTAVLNPKAIVFYMAFLAQFIDPAGSFAQQVVILTVTSTLVVAVLLSAYAMIATRARRAFQSRAARRKIGYAGGTFLLGGSVLMATTR